MAKISWLTPYLILKAPSIEYLCKNWKVAEKPNHIPVLFQISAAAVAAYSYEKGFVFGFVILTKKILINQKILQENPKRNLILKTYF